MAVIKTKYKGKSVKDTLNTTETKKKRLDCFDLLKMASQQETEKKIENVLVVSNLLVNFQRLIKENFISTSLNTPIK
ncbi:hypothetical protein [Emticicia sp. BO119]|uniref:hypothetical protein n=1 Tax=Emticicia sp. BO119 TaxID=2757768 RepID=UPI0015F094DA|nr:hypothetical protein [Emticicia sp. BO119]MBA4850938.1 hypothetical protein [Emticicia sp. BO119]